MTTLSPLPGPIHVLTIGEASLDQPNTSEGKGPKLGASTVAARVLHALAQQGVRCSGTHWPKSAAEAAAALVEHPEANCLFVVGPGPGALPSLVDVLVWLGRAPRTISKVVAVYTNDVSEVPERSEVAGTGKLAWVAIVSRPEMTEREAALYFQEFFAELHTHTANGITAGAVRFCMAKANRLAPGKAVLWA